MKLYHTRTRHRRAFLLGIAYRHHPRVGFDFTLNVGLWSLHYNVRREASDE
jgi:hypothetical protein